MNKVKTIYSIDDWVVHYSYGIGQIQKIEEKPINGELTPCFQVESQNGAQWWFPNDGVENPRIRPVASENMLKRAKIELQEPVQGLDPDKNLWKIRINEVTASGDFMAISQILRDLTVLRTQRKLNQMEVKAFNLFKDRFLSEWSATTNKDIDAIRPKFKSYLKVCEDRAMA